MQKFMFLLFAWLASINLNSTAVADDVALARDLLHEARDLNGLTLFASAELGAAFAKVGDLEASKKSFTHAWNTAAEVEDGVERRMVLYGIATFQAEAGQIEEAIEAAQRLPSRYERAMCFAQIAIVQAGTGELDAALRTVDLIPVVDEVWDRDSTLVVIALTVSERHDFAGAIRVLDLIPYDFEQAEQIRARLLRGEQLSPEEDTIQARAGMKSGGLLVIAQDQAEAGDLTAALQSARSIGLEEVRDSALRLVARVAADSGELSLAEELLGEIGRQKHKEHVLVRIVAALAQRRQFKEASQRVESIKEPSDRAQATFEIAAAHAAHGDAKAALSFFETATSLIPDDSDARNTASIAIVTAFAESRRLELAEEFARQIDDPATQSKAYQAIAVANAKRSNKADARRMFRKSRQAAATVVDPYSRTTVVDPYYKCVRLRELATAEFEAGEQEQARTTITSAIEAARRLEIGGGTDVIALTEVASTQSRLGDRDGAAASFEFARAAAAKYPEEPSVAQLLQGVAEAQASLGDAEPAIQSARQQKSALIHASMLLGVANGVLARRDE